MKMVQLFDGNWIFAGMIKEIKLREQEYGSLPYLVVVIFHDNEEVEERFRDLEDARAARDELAGRVNAAV